MLNSVRYTCLNHFLSPTIKHFHITRPLGSNLNPLASMQTRAVVSRDRNPSPLRADCRRPAHSEHCLHLPCAECIRHQSGSILCISFLSSVYQPSLSLTHTPCPFLVLPTDALIFLFTLGWLTHLCRNIAAPPMGQYKNYKCDTWKGLHFSTNKDQKQNALPSVWDLCAVYLKYPCVPDEEPPKSRIQREDKVCLI